MIRKLTLAALLCALTATLSAAPRITGIVPVTTANTAKVEVTLKGKPGETYDIAASIAPWQGGEAIWQGGLAKGRLTSAEQTLTCMIEGVKAQLWEPSAPNLYTLTLVSGDEKATKRIGFRDFAMREGRFWLNGRPIFLRGNAINPPGRGIPTEVETSRRFAQDYVRFLKGMNINMIRIPDNQTWMDVCDEEGMMIFGGRYGRPTGGTHDGPPADFDKAVEAYKYKDLGPFTPHPSVMIYMLANEMPYTGKQGDDYREFFRKAYERLIEWDHTRQYICNAGYGLGRSADIYDVHRYWGWYYNSFLTYLNLRRTDMWQNQGKTQAITFTECVGNYTGIDGSFNLCSRTKQPGSQLCWTGHLPAGEQARAALEYQAFVLKNATEMFRRMRTQNPYLAGVMPFTIMFHDWDGIRSFADMRPKPAAYQYGVSYQPVLLSWESWQMNAFAGSSVEITAHVVNDDDMGRPLDGATLRWELEGPSRRLTASGNIELGNIAYYGVARHKLSIGIPAGAPTGDYVLRGYVMQQGKVISANTAPLFVAGGEWKRPVVAARPVVLCDPTGKTATAMKAAGVPFTGFTTAKALPANALLVVGEDALGASPLSDAAFVKKFTGNGGRVLCMRQSPAQLSAAGLPVKAAPLTTSNNDPTYLSPTYEYVDGMNVNIERAEHPVFEGMERRMMLLWSDYTGFDESQAGFPAIYPVTAGFSLRGDDLSQTVVLANYSRNLAATALSETASGSGTFILSGFDLAARYGRDPFASRLFENLLRYAAGDTPANPWPLAPQTIVWGDYQSERGLVTGANNGLVLNPRPVVPVDQRADMPLKVDNLGYQYVGSYGGWNSRPGVQYVPYGRRPFAPFGYTLGGNDTVGAQNASTPASGFFQCTVPAGCSRMLTTVENPAGDMIEIRISVNGSWGEWQRIAPSATLTIESKLPAEDRVRIAFEGDRRNVVTRTEFL